jgi:hypothetical protein
MTTITTTTTTTTAERKRTIFHDLENISEIFRVEPHSERSVLVHFCTPVPGLSMMLSLARDRNLDVMYCESSFYDSSGRIGSYPGMPDVLYSKEETLTEIYRFYFLVYCVPKIASFSRFYIIPRKRKLLSLHVLSRMCLSTWDLREANLLLGYHNNVRLSVFGE